MNLIGLFLVCEDKEELPRKLQEWGLIPQEGIKAAQPGYGRKQSHIPGNLARYIFYKKCKELNLDRTLEFFQLAGKLYNPMNGNNALDPEHEAVSDVEDNLFLDLDSHST